MKLRMTLKFPRDPVDEAIELVIEPGMERLPDFEERCDRMKAHVVAALSKWVDPTYRTVTLEFDLWSSTAKVVERR